jgi:transposase
MTTTTKRKTYTPEFKSEALKLAKLKGVSATGKELGIYESQLYNWRASANKEASTSEREAELAAEVAKLKRQLAEQAEDLAILKKAL